MAASVDVLDVLDDREDLRSLRRDLREAAAKMSEAEARFLVDTYYSMQKRRIRAGNQIRALGETGEPHAILERLGDAAADLERMVKSALDVYSRQSPLGEWARAQKGIGPVIAAGLLAHIDLDRARTAGSIWAFAGLDPTRKWERGQKRPHNAQLKTLCWKMGESFVKVSGHEDAFYGHLYAERKVYEQKQNEAGAYAEQAARMLKDRPKHAQAAIYAEGKLPDGHLHMRAKRYAVKMFLAHYFEVGKLIRGEAPPAPYAVAHQGHAHYVPPPEPKVW